MDKKKAKEVNNSKNICATAICNCDSEFVNCLEENDFINMKPTCLINMNTERNLK
ncbi:hypothetical protein WUBG_09455 [Wuchereria bancrofti]|uniref:Uncharacterized protein n=1 Tax=Wuchereria bancrofti TaxID=6293 RepID=J9ERE6_WUCBA|nr:hypothetical protein WUBG_09455 [Wuchereria bancrofti]